MKNLVIQTIDGISFAMREAHTFPFLHEYGEVFCVFAQNDSGNISFGVNRNGVRRFIKVAGAKTAESCISPAAAVENLRRAVPVYEALAHPNLIRLTAHFSAEDLYVTVFDWVQGDGLFDYWNFEEYAKNPGSLSPRERFRALPCEKNWRHFKSISIFSA